MRTDPDATESVSLQPKPLALLLHLVLARPRGLQRRDTLLALFWPELDESRARNALSQALHRVRAALGDGCIVGRGQEEIGVDSSSIRCDAVAFERALEAGEPVEALELYRGDFLNGFHVSGAAGFERWLDGERARLRRLAKGAAEALAERAADEGHAVEAVGWLRRTIAIDPLDEESLRRLIHVLAGAGERAAAVRDYETFRRRLDEDYDLEPAPETRALIDEIRKHRETVQPADIAGTDATGRPGPPEAAGSAPIASDPELPSYGPEHDPSHLAGAVSLDERSKGPFPRRLMTGLGLSAGIAGALALGWAAWNGGGSESVFDARSVAVLPLANLSADPDDRYFVDGMHEAVIEHLAKLGDLRVVSSTSVQRYRGTSKSIPEIADELGVATVVEGGVQRAGGRARITAQLIEADSDDHLWAESWERELTAENLFAIQTEIARRIADGLEVSLSPEEEALIERQPTGDLQAYDYYLRGNHYFSRREPQAVEIAVDLYEKAIDLDPDFALAHARLSIPLSGTDRMTRAKEAIDRAVELDPDSPEVHLALGYYWYWGHTDYEKALEHLKIARDGGIRQSEIFHVTGELERRRGALGEALKAFGDALELAPLDAHLAWDLGVTYRLLRRYAEAEPYFDRAIALAPDIPKYHRAKAALHLAWRGDRERALEILEAAPMDIGETLLSGYLYYSAERNLYRIVASEYADVLKSRRLEATSMDSTEYYLARAELSRQMREPQRARLYYDSARAVLEPRIAGRTDYVVPDTLPPPFHLTLLGHAYAGLGREAEAMRYGEREVEIRRPLADAYYGPRRVASLADIYVMVGEYEAAIDELEYLLSVPSLKSADLLRVDPLYEPLHDHPRFEALLERSE
ncbi:MAG: BTAD domain-containing putative transcriptional regulator [Gemmatimonadota bacterium]